MVDCQDVAIAARCDRPFSRHALASCAGYSTAAPPKCGNCLDCGIICPACTKVKAKGDKIDGTSCADIIGRVLEEEYKVIPKQDK